MRPQARSVECRAPGWEVLLGEALMMWLAGRGQERVVPGQREVGSRVSGPEGLMVLLDSP